MEGSIRSKNTNYMYWFIYQWAVYNATTQVYVDYWWGWGGWTTTVVSTEDGQEVSDKVIVNFAEKYLEEELKHRAKINIVGDNNTVTVWGTL